jgi:hypothetical protein
MQRPGDCLATAVAAMLDLDVLDLPHTGAEDWPRAWEEIRGALASRGWRLSHEEWPNDTTMLSDLVEHAATWEDEIELAMLWLVSIGHPSWKHEESPDDGERHVIVMRGPSIVFDPGGDVMKRPPLDELRVCGAFALTPIDPSLFTYTGTP